MAYHSFPEIAGEALFWKSLLNFLNSCSFLDSKLHQEEDVRGWAGGRVGTGG